jgi:antitoxin (DNA-binding transcriptional repressor) of toxin-antitoxin stability system
MKTANVADLRNNFQKIALWISEGETVEINKKGKFFATLVPSRQLATGVMPKIDFAGRLKKIWGEKVFSDEEVQEMRNSERDGEEG